MALLCEGDWAGYEAHLLRGWTAARVQPHGVFVDIWPCGTAGSLYGMADALGRMRPIVVIEDRDYRDPPTAEDECARKKKEREVRSIQVGAWRTWQRHEIENYLLEPTVLFPVMAYVFEIDEAAVQARLEGLLSTLAVDQAAQCAIYQMRHPWTTHDLPGRLPPGLPGEARPQWSRDNGTALIAPKADEVEEALRNVIDRGRRALKDTAAAMEPGAVVKAFQDKCNEWASLSLDDAAWRVDWGGKEVLKYLRQGLAARQGWLDPATGRREPIDWTAMASRRERDERDREIEHAIQPLLVRELLAVLSKAPSGDRWEDGMRDEWQELAKACLPEGAESGAGPAEE